MAKATPEMIDAACKAVIDLHPEEGFEWPDGFNDDEVATARENMTAGIEAALAAAPVPVEPVVKRHVDCRYPKCMSTTSGVCDGPCVNQVLATPPAPAVLAEVEQLLAAFLEALDEWGCDDHGERAKQILDFQRGGDDLSAYKEAR